jgi:hypothetical protein
MTLPFEAKDWREQKGEICGELNGSQKAKSFGAERYDK